MKSSPHGRCSRSTCAPWNLAPHRSHCMSRKRRSSRLQVSCCIPDSLESSGQEIRQVQNAATSMNLHESSIALLNASKRKEYTSRHKDILSTRSTTPTWRLRISTANCGGEAMTTSTQRTPCRQEETPMPGELGIGYVQVLCSEKNQYLSGLHECDRDRYIDVLPLPVAKKISLACRIHRY